MKNKNILIGILVGLILVLFGWNIYSKNRSNNLLRSYQSQQYQSNKENEPNPPEGFQFEVPTGPFLNTENDIKPEPLCKEDTSPWIKIISPNGGETFILGQKTMVKWSSCNLPNTMHLRAYLERQAPLPDYEWQSPILFGNVNEGKVESSLNDGEQLVVLDSIHDVVPASYKLCITEYVTSPGQNIIQGCSDNSFIINSSSEESVNEVFTNQLGEVKSIKNQNNSWILSVDLLTLNPNFSPGSTDFFINQNPKIRDLNVTKLTKTFKCGIDSIPNVLQATSDFIKDIQKGEYKNRYFDINGNNITAIYEQCLP